MDTSRDWVKFILGHIKSAWAASIRMPPTQVMAVGLRPKGHISVSVFYGGAGDGYNFAVLGAFNLRLDDFLFFGSVVE